MQNIFHGLGIALITPFKEDYSIDYEALENLVNYHLDNRVPISSVFLLLRVKLLA